MPDTSVKPPRLLGVFDATMIVMGGIVGSGIFKSGDPERRAKAIVKAATYYQDPVKLLEASEELGEAMPGLEISKMAESELMQVRGW